MVIELYIKNKVDKKLYYPVCIGDITLTSRLKGSASVLSFTVKKDRVLNFHEGDEVVLKVNGKKMFKGFVFEKNRRDGYTINIRCYDLIRYLKYKNCYTLGVMPASRIVKLICQMNGWEMGEIEDTKWDLPDQVVDDSTYIDVIQKALDATYDGDFEEFVFFDDCGKLTLKNIKNMKTNFLVTESSCCGYEYTSSIDESTYNSVKIVQRDKDDGYSEVKEVSDEKTIERWGPLQYVEIIGENDIYKSHYASQLLKKYNKVTRRLSFTNVIGREDIRAGCQIFVKFNLGDVILNDYFVVDSCTHKIREDVHFMDLNVRSVTIDGFIE